MRALSHCLIASAAVLALMPSPSKAQSTCPEGTTFAGQWVEQSGDTDVTHIQCVQTPTPSCADAVKHRVVLSSTLNEQTHLAELNQKFNEEWTAMGVDGRDKLIMDSVGAIEKSIEAGTALEAEDYEELMKRAEPLRKEALKPGFKKELTALYAFKSIYAEAKPFELLATTNKIAKRYGDVTDGKVWGTTKLALRKVLATRAAEQLRLNAFMKKLPDKVREELAGKPDEGMETQNFETQLDLASDTTETLAEKLGKYMGNDYFGPTATIVKFAFDGALDDAQIWFSQDRVDQADTSAGQLAQRLGLVGAEYKKAVDDVRAACKTK